jgi:hypothetical protein
MSEHPLPGKHEQTFDREIGLRGIVWFAVGLGLLIVVSGFAVWGLFQYLRAREAARPVQVSPLLLQEGVPSVPEPHLQTTPEEDLRALRAAEDSLLHSYGWVEQEKGIARVPVERGVELLLHEGMPTRAEPIPWEQPGTWRDPSLQRVAREEDS